MSRPLRLEFPGAVYHITSRGNAGDAIFTDDDDRLLFLENLGKIVKRYKWRCHAYCLMDNHYHLLIETPTANLSKGMRQLNGIYTQAFNRRHARGGHVFQGRYKAIIVDRKTYLLELARYVVLNPIRLDVVRNLRDYRWSSYRATAGLAKKPDWLYTKWILSQFASDENEAQKHYRRFVKEGIGQPSPWSQVKGQLILGDDKFVKKMKQKIEEVAPSNEIPKRQRYLDRPELEILFSDVDELAKPERDRLIGKAHLDYGYSLSEIGRAVHLHYTTISKIVKNATENTV